MDTRGHLQELKWKYEVDTLNDILTVRDFCDKQHEWILEREKELKMMQDIKDRADKANQSINEELEKELGPVLKNTLQGLKKLDIFLDAVEKIAVTSPSVFTKQSFISEDESLESVQSVIIAARMICPLLINFKRNAETFFLPSLSNLAVLSFQLDKYIRITKLICERTEERYEQAQPVVKFSLDLSEDSMQEILDHLKQLCEIRTDQHTRLAFIFQESKAEEFIDLFSECHSRLEKHLSDLEESAVQLDRMKKGASISSVAGSTVGIVRGGLSIISLALATTSAGASLALNNADLYLRVVKDVNSLATGATEVGVNHWHGAKAQNIFKQYIEDMEKILSCLDQASRQEQVKGPAGFDIILTAKKLKSHAESLCKNIKSLAGEASAVDNLKTEGARNIPSLAADRPDIGQLAKGTPLALSKSARAGFIGQNALSIVSDACCIYKEINLANRSESETSQLIRSRAALWRSELEDWKKIHDSLRIGIWKVKKSQEVLEQPFLQQESQPDHQQWLFYPTQSPVSGLDEDLGMMLAEAQLRDPLDFEDIQELKEKNTSSYNDLRGDAQI